MQDEETKLVELFMSLRALHYDLYAEIAKQMVAVDEVYRERAIRGPLDNGLAIGFARGIGHLRKLVTEAPALHARSDR